LPWSIFNEHRWSVFSAREQLSKNVVLPRSQNQALAHLILAIHPNENTLRKSFANPSTNTSDLENASFSYRGSGWGVSKLTGRLMVPSKSSFIALNLLTTTFIKYPKLLLNSAASAPSALELQIIRKLALACTESDRNAIESQVSKINYVDRGPVKQEYHCFYARVIGLRIVDLSERLISNKQEHIIGRLPIGRIQAKLYAVEGEICSLEFSGPGANFINLSSSLADLGSKADRDN
jgi:hypothetical protein